MERQRLHLTFPDELLREPVITTLARDFRLDITIRRADVDLEVSWMVLELTGEPHELRAGRDFLEQRGVGVNRAAGDVLVG